jgi:hypothetical protein
MKVFIDIISESRRPKNGEFYLRDNGEIFQVNGMEYHKEWPIVVRHEIDIPDGAIGMIPLWQFEDGEKVGHKGWVPIPRPKVKKWRWWTAVGGVRVETASPYSEDEMIEKGLMWHKISSTETMIEVEE